MHIITVSHHIEVISYYYPYLLKHMDADSVSHMMHCNHLITDDDYEAITAAPNDSMMNEVILEYVRAMDLPTLLKFADLLRDVETQKSISTLLNFCTYVATYVYCTCVCLYVRRLYFRFLSFVDLAMYVRNYAYYSATCAQNCSIYSCIVLKS